MTEMRRSEENPILIPMSENTWEADGAFNGCPVYDGNKIHFVYRAVSHPQEISGFELPLSTIGYAVSVDGIHFKNRRQIIKPEYSGAYKTFFLPVKESVVLKNGFAVRGMRFAVNQT